MSFIEGKVNFVGNITWPQLALSKPAATLIPEAHIFRNMRRGLTTTIDRNPYTIKQGYQFRPSTLKKLCELKTKHPEVNVYIHSIIVESIQLLLRLYFSE